MKNKEFVSYLKLVVTCICSSGVQALAYTSFVQSGGFYPSGFSGISRLISNVASTFFHVDINYSVLYFAMNILTAVFVFKQIGKRFTVFSILQTALFSYFVSVFKPIFVIDDMLLLAVFGGIVNGIGCGIALANDFSTGGFDFLSIYFSSKMNRSIWNYILLTNACILCIAGILFNWEITMYSIIYQYATTQMVKMLHKRYTHDTLTIITTKPDEVSKNILSHIRHGITITQGQGAYAHKDEFVLYTVVNSFQTHQVVESAKEADSHVFINIQSSKEVIGNYYQLPLK